ncbi:MAG: MBL fold metallo-hydrolase [Thermodesulfobacteriota bacterium]|nr:MBL fold metallo-hydrolase [Thermodesulfobacteriota bacterium]
MEEKGVTRRDFVKGMAAGSVFGTIGAMGIHSASPLRSAFIPEVKPGNVDIGECKKVSILNISETSWFNNDDLMDDIKTMGGLLVNQWDFPWPPKGKPGNPKADLHPENAGGYSALIDVTLLDDSHKYILLDTGWDYEWTDERFKACGIDKMLKEGYIDFLYISHEHFDHFWGLPVTLKYKPDITMMIGGDYYPEGMQYIKDSGFKGNLIVDEKGTPKLYPLFPGCASYYFPIPIICRVFGEHSLYFNVKDAGIVQVTGCCHQSIIKFADTAYRTLKGGDKPYGVYGGLHISPFEDWDPKYDDLVRSLGDWNFKKIGCNHCTGVITAKKFIEAGYPIVQGTARFRSKDTAYLGNGDTIDFP